MKPALKYLLLLGVFVLLVVLLGMGLRLDPREVPSPLVGKSAPQFSLRLLGETTGNFSPAEMKGKVWLFNVWASWCEACREEHPLLMQISQQGIVPLYGMDYKDTDADALNVLKQAGNPYQAVATDVDGKVGIDYGVYGVPETYVIDKAGVIRYKQIGPITEEVLRQKILPLIKELQR